MKVIFVCLGNICRSPMAEFICKHLLKTKYKNLHLKISSAGTSDWNKGQPMHRGTAKKLEENNIEHEGFSSKKITKKMFDENDLIIVMDDSNYSDVTREFHNKSKIKKITEFLVENKFKYNEVPDPWYTNNFDETYKILSESINNFLDKLEKNN